MRLRFIHFSSGPGRSGRPWWGAWLAILALGLGGGCGLALAGRLTPEARAGLAAAIAGYVRLRAGQRAAPFWPAAAAWLRAAVPVWAAGLLPRLGQGLVALALALHGFALGLALGAAAALGPTGLAAAALSVLPADLLALPSLCYLGARAVRVANARARAGGAVPAAYWRLGAALGALALGSAGVAAAAPALLRAVGAG